MIRRQAARLRAFLEIYESSCVLLRLGIITGCLCYGIRWSRVLGTEPLDFDGCIGVLADWIVLNTHVPK